MLSEKQNLKMSWKPRAVGKKKKGTSFSIYGLSSSKTFSTESDASGFHNPFMCISALSSTKQFAVGLEKLEFYWISKSEEIL